MCVFMFLQLYVVFELRVLRLARRPLEVADACQHGAKQPCQYLFLKFLILQVGHKEKLVDSSAFICCCHKRSQTSFYSEGRDQKCAAPLCALTLLETTIANSV